jgi:anaerobic magnesium-protoporphyrin IX monomethyl ester cyclase
MNILFICSNHNLMKKDIPLRDYYSLLFGISYISSVLKIHRYNTKLFYLTNMNHKNGYLNNCIKDFSPQLICFSFVATEFPFIADIAQQIKRDHPGIYLLAGGPHASLCPEECISEAFDALCIGEGEAPTLELVQQLEEGVSPSGIQNLWIKHDQTIESNPCRPFMHIDNLPFPDRAMWREWIATPVSRMSILLGRGCPFSCSYCCNHALRKIAPGGYVRLRPIDSIIEELIEIKKDFPSVTEIYLEIETFGIDLNWSVALCNKLAELNGTLEEPLSFGVNLRVTANHKIHDIFKSLKKANFKYINIGLESGSEQVRRKILRRRESNADIIETVKVAKSHGIKVNFYNLIGIPGENYDDFLQTISINRTCLPDQPRAAIFFPYPETDLFNLCNELGVLDKKLDHDMERIKAALDLPGFPKKMIQKSYIWFDYQIYKGHKPFHKLLLGVLERHMQVKFSSDPLYILTIYNYLKKCKFNLQP